MKSWNIPIGAVPLHRVELCSSGPSVDAGLQITRGKYITDGAGSAGLIVQRGGDPATAYLLTCAHVLGAPRAGTDEAANNDNVVYSPNLRTFCDSECNKPIGQVVDDTLDTEATEFDVGTNDPVVHASWSAGVEKFAVDAALIKLSPGTTASNRLPKIGQMKAPRDLITEWQLNAAAVGDLSLPAARHLAVRKYGRTTEYTEGTIRRLARVPVRLPGSQVTQSGLALQIDTGPGQKLFTAEFEPDLDRYREKYGPALTLDQLAQHYRDQVTELGQRYGTDPQLQVTVNAMRTLKVTSRTFAQKGDSGSPVVDQDNRVIGIVQGVPYFHALVKGGDILPLPTGITIAIFVNAALGKLNATFLEGGQHAAGVRIVVPGMAIDRGVTEPLDWDALTRNAGKLEATPAGARIGRLARLHFEEIRSLIHHRRRVTVTWHRSRGPAFLVAILWALQSAGTPVPQQIDGVTLEGAISALRRVLLAEGSASLRACLLEHQEEILTLSTTLASQLSFHAQPDDVAACSA